MLRINSGETTNFDRRSKTPGGRLVYLYTKKRVATPKCPCGTKLSGVSWTKVLCGILLLIEIIINVYY